MNEIKQNDCKDRYLKRDTDYNNSNIYRNEMCLEHLLNESDKYNIKIEYQNNIITIMGLNYDTGDGQKEFKNITISEKTSKKAYQKPIIKKLKSEEWSQKNIAEVLAISESYISELINK